MSFEKVFIEKSQINSISSDIKNGNLPLGIVGLSNIHKAHYISSLSLSLQKKCIIVCETEGAASRLVEDLNFFDGGAFLYPQKVFHFHSDAVYSREFEIARLGVLSRIIEGNYKYIVTTLSAAAQYTIPREELEKWSATLKEGYEISPERLSQILVSAGYSRVDAIDAVAQYSLRGEILDFFPPDCAEPIRLEFWGDEISSLAHFDLDTQRRSVNIPEIKITPTGEIIADANKLESAIVDFCSGYNGKNKTAIKQSFLEDADKLRSGLDINCLDKYISLVYENPATLFDYITDELFFVTETRSTRVEFEEEYSEFNKNIKSARASGELPTDFNKFCLDFSQIKDYYLKPGAVYIDSFEPGTYDTPVKNEFRINDAMSTGAWNGQVSTLIEDLELVKDQGYRIVVVAGTEKWSKCVADELCENNIYAEYYDTCPSEFRSDIISVLPGSLSMGFEYKTEKFMLISYRRGALSNTRKKRVHEKRKRTLGGSINLEEIKEGDYVVHYRYGIGRFHGIQTRKALNGIVSDYLCIEYSDVQMYIKVENIDELTRYMSPDDTGKEVKLNSFNSTKAWYKARSKAEESVKEVAKELANLYHKRLQEVGHQFCDDDDLQSLFESKFEYEETEDQIVAIRDIKRDMMSVHPMDRLLLGDVGFGKTEVALRAVFKCVEEGKQCAILVPTTILALQHFQTIKRRFDGFAINVEMLSRFRTTTQKTKIKKDIKAGIIDIVVGTHGLIADSVVFKDLGLLVIDEEQRFGVKQKEKLKNKFPLVDVLTLSATPIPRTLNMAMSGIRDMSVLEIPPQDRHPVQSYVVEHNMDILCSAIEREINRGGQVYYLYNNIDALSKIADEIHLRLPNAKIGIGHGQMKEEELSEVWRSLLDGEIDILICTTIIETGVDVPNANTLIIEEANRLGLSQLHQIRGRVGRSNRRAYAYFTYKRDKAISPQAQARLEAIEKYTSFGSGYHIAMRDLEIRGAGEILGTEQHGHMEAVGYDMYIKMLNDAIAELGEVEYEKPKPKTYIQINTDMLIPEDYITSYAHRIEMYKRVIAISSSSDARDLLDEIKDRFGTEIVSEKSTGEIPKCVRDLIKYAELKARATELDIAEIKQDGGFIKFYTDKANTKLGMLLRQKYKLMPLMTMEGYKPIIKISVNNSTPLIIIEKVISAMELQENDSNS